jgi:hypothetical protein
MPGVWQVDLKSRRRAAVWPSCQQRSSAGHSLSRRTVADLPLAGATLVLHLQVRRVFGRHAAWPRRMLAERVPSLGPVRGRHRTGVCTALRHIGLALGGRAGARLGRTLERFSLDHKRSAF